MGSFVSVYVSFVFIQKSRLHTTYIVSSRVSLCCVVFYLWGRICAALSWISKQRAEIEFQSGSLHSLLSPHPNNSQPSVAEDVFIQTLPSIAGFFRWNLDWQPFLSACIPTFKRVLSIWIQSFPPRLYCYFTHKEGEKRWSLTFSMGNST